MLSWRISQSLTLEGLEGVSRCLLLWAKKPRLQITDFGRVNEFILQRFPCKHPVCDYSDPAGKLILWNIM